MQHKSLGLRGGGVDGFNGSKKGKRQCSAWAKRHTEHLMLRGGDIDRKEYGNKFSSFSGRDRFQPGMRLGEAWARREREHLMLKDRGVEIKDNRYTFAEISGRSGIRQGDRYCKARARKGGDDFKLRGGGYDSRQRSDAISDLCELEGGKTKDLVGGCPNPPISEDDGWRNILDGNILRLRGGREGRGKGAGDGFRKSRKMVKWVFSALFGTKDSRPQCI